MRPTWFVTLGLVAACGCGSGTHRPPVVRDSVGIAIVENLDPAWARSDRWTLSDAPIVDIGTAEKLSKNSLERVVSAVRLADGTIAVANAGSKEIRWYDDTGQYLRASGGKLGAAIEFVSIERVDRLGPDSVIAYDFGSLGLSVFARDGTFRRATSLIVAFGSPPGSLRGVFANGSLLFVRGPKSWVRSLIRSGQAPDGLMRGPADAFHYSSEGMFLSIVGSFPGSEQFFSRGTRFVRARARPFGRDAVFAVLGDQFYVGYQNEYEIELRDTNDSLTALIRVQRNNRLVSPKDIEQFKINGLVGVHERNRDEKIAELDGLSYPETMPAYGGIITDADGNLWVAEYDPFPDETLEWTVFDTDHHMLGAVEVPSRFSIYQIGSDFILGRMIDRRGIEHIQIYSIEKPSAQGD